MSTLLQMARARPHCPRKRIWESWKVWLGGYTHPTPQQPEEDQALRGREPAQSAELRAARAAPEARPGSGSCCATHPVLFLAADRT